MTEIKFFRNALGDIVKGEFSGHTGFGEEGSDIVCASVSSALYMALCGMEKVAGVSFGYETGDGYTFFVLPDDLERNKRDNINILLESLVIFLRELEGQYPQNVVLTEVEV